MNIICKKLIPTALSLSLFRVGFNTTAAQKNINNGVKYTANSKNVVADVVHLVSVVKLCDAVKNLQILLIITDTAGKMTGL